MLRAGVMLLEHIGYTDKAAALTKALDYCMFDDKKYVITGRNTGATTAQFGEYVLQTTKSFL